MEAGSALSPAPLYLLAGGRSERMGRDKARVEVSGRPLILHVVAQCGYAPEAVTVVAAPGRSYADLGLRTVEDASEHEGPFSGLQTLLRHAAPGPLLVIGCDQWGLREAMLAPLLSALQAGAMAAAYRGVLWHPLPLAIDAAAADAVRQAFDQGERSIWRWLERCGAAALPEPQGWSQVVSVDDAAALAGVVSRLRAG